MADLTSAILDLDEVKANFTVVERPWGPTLLHNTLPIWIIEYDAFPRQHQPKHWQAFYSPDTMGREPWTERNYRLSSHTFEWIEPAGAVAAALAKAAAWPAGRRGYE
jgi:hypothetical protein